jgi:hypothetical protein
MNSTVRLLAVCAATAFALGCQGETKPGTPSTSSTGALDSSRSAAGGNTQGSADAPQRADEPDTLNADAALHADPGMDPNRDKTLAAEQPSGDESSDAGPNEGDAEPPLGSEGARQPE